MEMAMGTYERLTSDGQASKRAAVFIICMHGMALALGSMAKTVYYLGMVSLAALNGHYSSPPEVESYHIVQRVLNGQGRIKSLAALPKLKDNMSIPYNRHNASPEYSYTQRPSQAWYIKRGKTNIQPRNTDSYQTRPVQSFTQKRRASLMYHSLDAAQESPHPADIQLIPLALHGLDQAVDHGIDVVLRHARA